MASQKSDIVNSHFPKYNKKKHKKVLVSFESGHYKVVEGSWVGSPIWTHFRKPDGKMIHINKDKVEYFEEI